MAIVKFDQDSTQPFGTGIFTNDAGRSLYTTDPDTARSLPPTPAPPSADDNEPAAPPGTTVRYAGDTSSPYVNAVASNDGATGSAAVGAQPDITTPQGAVSTAVSLIPPASIARPDITTPQGAVSTAVSLIPPAKPSQIAQPAAPITKTSTTTVNGRSKVGVENQIATDQSGLDSYGNTLTADAKNADDRAQSSLDSQLSTKTAQQTQASEDKLQYEADQRAIDAQVANLQDLPDGQLDPDRFVNSLSTGSKIGMAVLAAISGFASGLRNAGSANSQGGPPDLSVFNVLNRRIDQDIEAQKDQLAQGRIRKNNLIARAIAKGATAGQAEATARGQLWQLSNDIGTLQAQKLGLQGAQLDAAKNALAGMQYQASQHYGDLRAQEESRVQTTNERETKPVATGQILELQNKALENYGKAIDAGTDPDTAYQQSGMGVLGLSKPTGQTKEQRAEAAKAGERTEGQAKAASVVTSATPYADAIGLEHDPKTGKFSPPVGHEGDSPADTVLKRTANFFSGSVMDSKNTRAERQRQTNIIRSARTRAAQAIVAATGGGMKLGEAEDSIDGETLAEIADNLNAQLSTTNELRNPTERTSAQAGNGLAQGALGAKRIP